MNDTQPYGDVEAVPGLPDIGIPAEVLFHTELSSTEMILFGLLRNLSQSSRGCWASNQYLGGLLRVGPQTISNAVANLRKHGFIAVNLTQQKGGTLRQIFIDPQYTTRHRKIAEGINDKLYGDIRKVIGGYKKNYMKDDNEEEKEVKEHTTSLSGFSNLSDSSSLTDSSSLLRRDEVTMKRTKPAPKHPTTATPTQDKNDSAKKYIPLAYALSKANGIPKLTPTERMVSAHGFRQLIEENGVSLEEVKEVLHWYEHSDSMYKSIVADGVEFQRKYSKNKSQWERSKNDNQRNAKQKPRAERVESLTTTDEMRRAYEERTIYVPCGPDRRVFGSTKTRE